MPCLGCLFAAGAASFPRLALIFMWIFTTSVTRAFHGAILLPILGIIFLPYTTLFYVFVYNPFYGMSFWGWLLVTIGFLLDLGTYSGGYYSNRRRMAPYGTR
jgi:hypothetical protein